MPSQKYIRTMKPEEKQLLIKDICARLPYGVIVNYILFSNSSVRHRVLMGRVYMWSSSGFYIKKTDKYSDNWTWNYETWTSCEEFDDFKPYLRPMSSMTDKEKKEYQILIDNLFDTGISFLSDWLNKNMFDYRDLIKKGLALPAPEDMYNI